MTALIQQPLESSSIIPAEQFENIRQLAATLADCRAEMAKADQVTRAFIQAQAIQLIEDRIGPPEMSLIEKLMDSPLGFKTDRPPGATAKKGPDKGKKIQPYARITIKRCVIVALLNGAQLYGNEFNIIAGQCYLTKEFKQKAVQSFEGITELKIEIGVPERDVHGKRAVVESLASWKLYGKSDWIKCNKNGIDNRIVVNCHETSGTDQLLGLARSKLYGLILTQLTGMNMDTPADAPAIEGSASVPNLDDDLKECETLGDTRDVWKQWTTNGADPEFDARLVAACESRVAELEAEKK